MAGVNPYIQKARVSKPEKRFRVSFLIEETKETKVFEVDPAKLPFGRTGLEGSILDLAYGADIEIDHSCGGVCACATCHVQITKGMETCNPATEDEEDMLDTARGLTTESRLGCQCVPDGTTDIAVTIPAWNKNLIKEGH